MGCASAFQADETGSSPVPRSNILMETWMAEDKSNMKFFVESIVDTEDGGANMIVNMDYETLLAFAKIGVMKAIEDAANKAIAEHGNS